MVSEHASKWKTKKNVRRDQWFSETYGKIMLIILFMTSWNHVTFFFSNIGKNIIFLEKKHSLAPHPTSYMVGPLINDELYNTIAVLCV